jgi:hypothetical protein
MMPGTKTAGRAASARTMGIWTRIAIPTMAASATIAVSAPGLAAEPGILAGYLENVQIMPSALELKAKLDTGADHSSLNASEIRIFNRDGKRWVWRGSRISTARASGAPR